MRNVLISRLQSKCIQSSGFPGDDASLADHRVFAFFVALPLAYRFSPVRIPAPPVLWVVAAYAGWLSLTDPRFDRAKLWNLGQLPGRLGVILGIFAVVAFAIWLGVRKFAPDLGWSLVTHGVGVGVGCLRRN